MTKGIVRYALLGQFTLLLWGLHALRSTAADQAAIDRFLITREDFMHQVRLASFAL